MDLRPYQSEAVAAILGQWDAGVKSTLLVLPTGTGKTIVFSKVIEERVRRGGNVLVLAHREELLRQASDKLAASTGLATALEKAESSAADAWENVTVGSVQTLQGEARLARFAPDHYDTIVVDEAHHAVSPSYRRVLDHFPEARILGVTATADRGDRRSLGEVFDTIAYEYTLPRAIRDGYLSPIRALTLPLEMDLRGVKTQNGDYQAAALGSTLEPYLAGIAAAVRENCAARKTVAFLPLVATSQRFRELLEAEGVEAREVNGESEDRAETLEWFRQAGPGSVLCNSMLLTEGWDEPSVDCVCVLRPTKVRALYAQMVGRGTRLSPGKKDLLLLDFLWMTERHDLCRPAHLVCQNEDISARVAELLAERDDAAEGGCDLLEAEEAAEGKARQEREEALRRELEAQRMKKKALVDPLQFEMSIAPDGKAALYEPDPFDLKAQAPPSEAQLAFLEKAGIYPGDIRCAGQASHLIDAVAKRRKEGLSTPKQIRCLERYGFVDVGTWPFDAAGAMITRIAANCWRVPNGVSPANYRPQEVRHD